MADSSGWDEKLNDSPAIALTGKIMVGGIVLLFFVVVVFLFLHLYAKCFWSRREEPPPTPTTATRLRRRRLRFDFVPGHVDGLRRGLDPAILKSLPVVILDSKDFKDGLDCAVCISELADGEKVRLLPKCNHWFHADCIDMWFQSHATCPLCRNPVSDQSSKPPPPQLALDVETSASAVGVLSAESPNFPTNVLFWGNQSRVRSMDSSLEEGGGGEVEGPASSSQPNPSSSSSSSSTGNTNRPDEMLVIDIPRQIVEDEEEQKSPMPTRLRSLKRLLSRGRVNPCSPRTDTEQGGRVQC